MPAHRNFTMTLHSMNLALQRLHISDCCIVKIFAPDVRLQTVEKFLPQGHITSGGAGFDHRRTFPILALVFVVDCSGFHGDCHLRGAWVGAQAQIDAEHITVLINILQQSHQITRELHEKSGRFNASIERGYVGIIKHDEINIAGVVQLPGPMLTHGENDVTAI